MLLALNGCTSKAPPPGIHYPITNGFHTHLPTDQQRILIFGNPLLTRIVGEWLKSHHYSSILPSPQNSSVSSNRQTVFTMAAEQNADFVLLLEQEEGLDGALLEPHCGTHFTVSVTVRGLSVEGQETVLQGTAYYPHCVEHSDKVIQHLTCQALATAWGFRPSGQLEIPSHLACTAGQTIPIPTH